MDFCRNVTVSGEYHHQQEHVLASPPPCSKITAAAASKSPLDDLFSCFHLFSPSSHLFWFPCGGSHGGGC